MRSCLSAGDGSFSHHIGEGSNAMATSQALIAVGDLLSKPFERLAASYQAGFPNRNLNVRRRAPQPVDGEQQGKRRSSGYHGRGRAASLGLVLLSLMLYLQDTL